jgi:DNA polymerase III subunit gamma/tau
VWDLKYRPLRFADVLGQDGSIQILKNRLRAGSAGETSYIFAGGHGQGKTTLARILARALVCENLDKSDPEPCNECDACKAVLDETSLAFRELDAASNGTIDKIRAIVDKLQYVVYGAERNIILFDEMHRMSKDAQDVLLKPIEDKRLIALLCTTESEKIRGTIRSRCEEHVIRKVPREVLLTRMRMILETEGVEYEEDAILTVIDFCDSHVRDIINRLGTVAQMGDVTLEAVRENLHLGMVPVYYQVLLALTEPAKAVEMVDRVCDSVVPDEVAAGLAEAAMNAYRVANGMFASFTSVDRKLAAEVNQKYGSALITLAEHFSKARYSTKVALLCDVLTALSLKTTAPARIIVEQAVVAPKPEAPAQEPETPAQAPAPKPEAPQEPIKPQGPDVRPDGIGPVGQDPFALTTVDHKAIPKDYPRGHRTTQQVPVKGKRGFSDDVLTPKEWRQEFARIWPGGNL